jgi:hypothetical protein
MDALPDGIGAPFSFHRFRYWRSDAKPCISAIVILFGAKLNSEIEHQTARDSTVQPLGARGAVMADTVGKAQ